MTLLARFRHDGRDRLGVVRDEGFIDATNAYAAALAAAGVADAQSRALAELPPDALVFFQRGADSLEALARAVEHADRLDHAEAVGAGVVVPRSAAEVLVPIPDPPKIVCVARNYGKHAAEAGLEVSEIPILFARFAVTQVAHGQPVVVPTVSEQLDWEGELAIVVGRRGRHITREEAFDHVAGYTIFNDVTVRDYQFRVTQYTEGKNFHATGPVGPHIALADEGLDPHALRLTTTVNGVVKQDASTDELIFDVPTLIAHISAFVELEPGDLIPTGTPAGVGFKKDPPEFLRHGDVVEVTVEGIGTLSNPVRDESAD